ELRQRLIWSLLTFVVAFGICYAFAEQIYAFLTHPLAEAMEGQPGRRIHDADCPKTGSGAQ
ncbi:MAG: twin-arginine translocase subunit TatC, partial [Alphaproteobacteria bacterium]